MICSTAMDISGLITVNIQIPTVALFCFGNGLHWCAFPSVSWCFGGLGFCSLNPRSCRLNPQSAFLLLNISTIIFHHHHHHHHHYHYHHHDPHPPYLTCGDGQNQRIPYFGGLRISRISSYFAVNSRGFHPSDPHINWSLPSGSWLVTQ